MKYKVAINAEKAGYLRRTEYRKKSLEYLQLLNNKYSVKMYAFSIMGNHVKSPDFLSTDLILGYFYHDVKVAMKKYVSYVKEQACLRKNSLKEIKAGVILRSEYYIEWLKENVKYDSRLD